LNIDQLTSMKNNRLRDIRWNWISVKLCQTKEGNRTAEDWFDSCFGGAHVHIFLCYQKRACCSTFADSIVDAIQATHTKLRYTVSDNPSTLEGGGNRFDIQLDVKFEIVK